MKLVVLDRDGVINEDRGAPIVEPDDWVALPGSLEAIGRLHQAGVAVAIATNQSGLDRGLLSIEALHAVHRRMHDAVAKHGGRLDLVVFCPHAEATECDCRKPAPGMFYTVAERLGIAPADTVAVGDSLRDVQAAMAAAARPVIVRTGKGQRTLDDNRGLEHVQAFDDLAGCVEALLSDDAGAEA